MNTGNNETEILTNIYSELTNNISQLKEFQINLAKIKDSINKLNNNYFKMEYVASNISPYLEMDETYERLVSEMENVLVFVEESINNTCEHEWIDDLIDITPDVSKHICYCSKCEITKR